MLRRVECWVLAALCLTACGDLSETVDASVCQSKERWVAETTGHEEMLPGHACMTCHNGLTQAPRFSLGGTVFASDPQSDDCYGLEGAQVVVTDAVGVEHKFDSNRSGNFFSIEGLEVPYTAKLVFNGVETPMITPQTNGDCNSCHRQGGMAVLRIRPINPP